VEAVEVRSASASASSHGSQSRPSVGGVRIQPLGKQDEQEEDRCWLRPRNPLTRRAEREAEGQQPGSTPAMLLGSLIETT
jgi:hypothetical protein